MTGKAVAIAGLLLVLSAGFVVLNASRVGLVRGCPDVCSKPRARGDGPLRVMVLNVRHGFPRFGHLAARLDHIAAEIRDQDPDVVLLQEVPWTRRLGDGVEYLSRATDLNHVSVRDNGNRWLVQFDTSLAILSRFPLSDAQAVELQPKAGFFENRLALRAATHTPRGTVQVVVTHLTSGDPAVNRRQSQALAEWVSALPFGPTVVGGDFNAVPESPQMLSLASRWLDTYRHVNRSSDGFTCCAGQRPQGRLGAHTERIDYLFVVPDPRIPVAVHRSRRVLTRPFRFQDGWLWASDHAGLLSDIDWRERGTA